MLFPGPFFICLQAPRNSLEDLRRIFLWPPKIRFSASTRREPKHGPGLQQRPQEHPGQVRKHTAPLPPCPLVACKSESRGLFAPGLLHILQQVPRLTLQQVAKPLDIRPGHKIPVAELLDGGFSKQFFPPEPRCIIPRRFQSRENINFVPDRHIRPPFPLWEGAFFVRPLLHCTQYTSNIHEKQV